MSVDTFGAIDVGSDEITLTIAECSKKNGIRFIDQVTHRINLGGDTFQTGKISYEHVSELEKLLSEYRAIMDDYGVKNYKAYGTSAIREMVNRTVVLSEIEQMADVVGIIHEGRLVAEGTPEALRARWGGADMEEVFIRAIGAREEAV